MALVGYASVSTEEQDLAPQFDALHAAGCGAVFEEHASEATRAWALCSLKALLDRARARGLLAPPG